MTHAAAAPLVWRRPAVLRVVVWGSHLALPLVVAAWLLGWPQFDGTWKDGLGHLVLVGLGSLLAVGLGIMMSRAATEHDDARIQLLSLALVAAAGFQALHALATPSLLVGGRTAGFDVSSPLGMVAAAGFAAASALELTPSRQAWLRRNHGRMLAALLGAMGVWFVVSVTGLPPLDRPYTIEDQRGPLLAMGVATAALYVWTAWGYFRTHRRRPAVMLLGVITALVLLAESMVLLATSRTWQASWWEWHVTQAMAFAFLAYAARVSYRREGTATGLFRAVGTEETVQAVQRGHREALESLVASLRQGTVGPGDAPRAVAHVGEKFELTEQQRDVLGESAGLYRELDTLFRSYLSPDVADDLIADPSMADLGGRLEDVTVLMADLMGFTAFSERTPPGAVVRLLNQFYGIIVPIILDEGGTVVQFVGDAVMAVFNAPRAQEHHVEAAVRCGLRIQAAVAPIVDATAGAPCFRVGVNTGPALVGNIGAQQMRNFTAIGDTTNTAARIESLAGPGEVAVSAEVLRFLPVRSVTRSLGAIAVKNRTEPVDVYVVESLG